MLKHFLMTTILIDCMCRSLNVYSTLAEMVEIVENKAYSLMSRVTARSMCEGIQRICMYFENTEA